MAFRKHTSLTEAARALSNAREATPTLMLAVAESCAQLLADAFGDTVSVTLGRNVMISRKPTDDTTQ